MTPERTGPCPACHGAGFHIATAKQCRVCKGRGEIRVRLVERRR